MTIKFKFIDNQNRGELGEGRDYGMGFAFLKRTKDVLRTVQPISPCKDYLNDVLYSERTGKPFKAHGLNTTKKDIFDHDEAYMVMSICKQGAYGGYEYMGYKDDLKLLDSNYPNMEKMINYFEEQFKVEGRTKLTKLKDNRILISFPLFWTFGTYLISLYTLLMRVAPYYKGGDVMKFLKTHKGEDTYVIKAAMPKIDQMINGHIPKQNLVKLHNVHNCGIKEYHFPAIDKKPLLVQTKLTNIWA